jgi:hypothetical protein
LSFLQKPRVPDYENRGKSNPLIPRQRNLNEPPRPIELTDHSRAIEISLAEDQNFHFAFIGGMAYGEAYTRALSRRAVFGPRTSAAPTDGSHAATGDLNSYDEDHTTT